MHILSSEGLLLLAVTSAGLYVRRMKSFRCSVVNDAADKDDCGDKVVVCS